MAIKKQIAERGVSLFKRKGSQFWTMKWRGVDGKQIMRSTQTSDPKLAKEIRDALAVELLRSRFSLDLAVKDFTPDDAWDFYLEHQTSSSERTIYHNKSAWECFWRVTGCPTLASVQPVDIARFQKAMLAEDRKPSYVNSICSIVSSVYSRLIRWGELTCQNPFKSIDLLNSPKPEAKFRPWPEVESLIAKAKEINIDTYLFCILCAYAGMRHGEAIAARWEDVNWEEGHLRVRGTKTKGSAAIVPLHDILRAALCPFREEQGYIIAGKNKDLPSSIRPHGRWNYQSRWETLIAQTGFKGSPHTLRHSFASHLLSLGYDTVLIVKLMRHSNIAMTAHYANLAAVVPKIDRF